VSGIRKECSCHNKNHFVVAVEAVVLATTVIVVILVSLTLHAVNAVRHSVLRDLSINGTVMPCTIPEHK
jgi:hypothetical protein